MTGLGIATDELVNRGIVRRVREGDRIVLDTPSRRDFWFGHGFVLVGAPPDASRVAVLIAEGRARFAALGAQRFVIQWECAPDAPDAVRGAPAQTSRERSLVMAYDGPVPAADPDDGPAVLYHRLGFVPVSRLHAVVVPVVPDGAGVA